MCFRSMVKFLENFRLKGEEKSFACLEKEEFSCFGNDLHFALAPNVGLATISSHCIEMILFITFLQIYIFIFFYLNSL